MALNRYMVEAARECGDAVMHVLQTPVLCCPGCWTNTAMQLAAERRRYLDWLGALWWIGSELRGLNIMETIALTEAMPAMTPWRSA